MDPSLRYDCDGFDLESGDILESSGLPSLASEARYLATAPLWCVEHDGTGNWRIQPQRGGRFRRLTQVAAWCCRFWPIPVTDIAWPKGRRFPEGTPPEKKFHAVWGRPYYASFFTTLMLPSRSKYTASVLARAATLPFSCRASSKSFSVRLSWHRWSDLARPCSAST